MRTFKEYPKDSICPICKTNKNKECVLVAKDDKIKGNNAEAEIFHLDCIELMYSKTNKFLYQRLK